MADEDMAAQLRALTELVQQLQVENARLRSEVSQSSSSVSSDVLLMGQQQPPLASACVTDGASIASPVSTLERYVYIPRERKCPRFSGKISQDSLTVEDWVEEARRHLSMRPMLRAEQALAIFNLLDGEARTEIRFRPVSERDDPEKIFNVLISIYGCSQSYISLQKQFFQRRQLEGESLREYSHALMSLMDVIKRKDLACFANPDTVLRDQFIEFVRDNMLRRELRRQVRLDPTLSFLDARKEALRWVEEGENPCVQRPRAQSFSITNVTDPSAQSNAILSKSTDELTEVKESLRKQQAQLDTILKRLDSSVPQAVSGSPLPPAPSIPRVGVRSQQYRYHPDGRPICLRCNQPGHIARFCKTELGNCPTVEITIGGVTVACLLDTGSMVTTITQQFYEQYLQPQLQFQLQPCQWLKLKAANGLDIPYLGYLETTIGILGKTLPKMGILVVKNSSDFATQSRREQVPGLLGMNIISSCYQELFLEQGARLFEDAPSQHAGKVWQRAFSECQLWERALETGYVGPARVQKGPAVRVPAGTLKLVPATCHQGLGATFNTCFLEPVSFVDGRLPGDLLVPSACLAVTSGMVNVPVVNVGSQDRWLWPKTILGELHIVQSPVLKSSVQFHVQNDDSEEVALIQSVEVESNPNVDFSHLTWPTLSCSERQQAQALLEKYANVFSHGDGDLGCTDLLQHTIPLLDDAPLRQRYRRLPPSQYDLVKTHIQELVEQGIVKPSCSPYASPIVVVQKKDGSIRLCVDYRQLNAKTRKDAFPLPRIEETLDALSGAKLFSTLDLASGYNQVSVAPQDREKTAFCTPFGLLEFNRMPFGLCNAPSTFQRLMERIFGDQSLHALLLYLDDIVIFSSTFDQHLERLEMVLSRLQTHNLKVKLKKCNFFQTEVGYLGHVISAAGVATDPEKIRAVAEWSRPNSVRELRSFLGFASYYRRFVEGFAGLAAPLHKLVGVLQGTRKRAVSSGQSSFEQHWNHTCEKSFSDLKERLIQAPVLGYADFTRPFILETDASNLGLGAVLSQEQGGLRRPIAFASRGLRPSERNMTNYSSMKLELLALKWAMTEKFREYLLGNKVTVYTDNNPLRYLESLRWVSQLALFEYEIKYRPGTANRNADALSRLPLRSVDHSINVPPGFAVPLSISMQERPPGLSPQVAEASMVDAVPARNRADLKALQAADPCIKVFLQFWVQGQPPTVAELKEMPREVQQLVKQWPRVRETDGVLYRLVQIPPSRELVWQLLLPKELQGEVLTSLHDNHGHQGVERTTALIRQRCYWPNMWQDIKKWCTECERCSVAKASQPRVRTFLGSLLASRPLEIIAIDFTVLDRASNGQENVLVVTDVFSKFTQAYPTPDQRASTVAKILTEKWFYVYGVPKRIHSDQGRSFEGELLRRLCDLYGITKSRTTPYHPEGNGQCERFNRTLHDLLRALPSEQKRKWPQLLPQLLFAYNTTVHQSTQHSPYELMFGQKPKLPVDQLLGGNEVEVECTPSDWVAQHQEYLTSIYISARRQLETAAERRRANFPESIPILPSGTLVYCRNHFQGRHKIQDIWSSTVFEIVSCTDEVGTLYKIRPHGKDGPNKVMHRSELKLVPHGIDGSRQSTSNISCSPVHPISEASSEDMEVGSPPQVVVVHTRVDVQAEPGPELSGHSVREVETARYCSPTRIREPLRVEPPVATQEPESELSINADVPIECCLDQPVGQSGVISPLPRRSNRRTAGRHPNPFHLPQSMAQNGSIGIAESFSVQLN
ncbi:hypothetical protein M9458_050649 [Cirrhinus mrigala]|uniref:Gypsy retrotransposon integrase-like protein 1 n=1 Tax=Cirrhinus mrigala TaxID=683832 RepID=A0ABD0MVM3_CIRMR